MSAKKLFFFLLLLFFFNACQPANKKEEVVVRAVADPETLNPIGFSSANAVQIIALLYQSLLTIDLQDQQLKPLLVEKLPAVRQEKGKSYFTYQLRKEAVWDDQNPITGRDVAFTLKVIKAPLVKNNKLRIALDYVQDIKLDPRDPRKFTIECEGYVPEMGWETGDFAILPVHLVDPQHLLDEFSVPDLINQYDSLSNHPKIKTFADWFNSARFTRDKQFLKGSGGYELVDWKTGQYVRLKQKENWWATRLKPQLSYITAQPANINFQIIPENYSALVALNNGQLDVFSGIPPTNFVKLKRDKSFLERYALFTPATYDFTYIGINGRNKKFADKRTRQALAHLLDIPKIITITQHNFAKPTVGIVNPIDKQFYNDSIQPYSLNLQEAEHLLRLAGWQQKNNGWQKQINGQVIPLAIKFNYRAGNNEFENIAVIFQEAAAKIHIPVTIEPLESVLLSNKLRAQDFEVTIRYSMGNPGAFNYKPILHSESAVPGGLNFTGFGTTQSDKLIEAISQTKDNTQRAKLLRKFQEVMHEESNLIFLYFNIDRLAIHKHFTNLKVSAVKPGYDISAFTLKSN
ncbi:ABC transporter substrate-binding protein [Adhaeribacter arboris]|uniref:ABC transporter substrate-binding protein n=1 Tax=Adhaeribacter arboris TaxID=2072846 RepID=A0A2T2YH80_9BACT|nr:ABC transporter substrate-binding protein [Adhaeribacter arboris]PSR54861.1 ABC transporter substrate-binding protein [Adhaeribacter arboris]